MRGPRKFARVPLERRRNKKREWGRGGEVKGEEEEEGKGRESEKGKGEGGETEGMPFHREIVTDSRR